MTMTSIGDLAGNFANRLHTVRIKTELLQLNNELSTGRPTDPVAHLGGDTSRLALIDRDIAVASARVSAATGLGQFLTTMQTALDAIEGVRSNVVAHLLPINGASTSLDIARASDAGAGAFRQIVSQLNSSYGGAALFAGTATDGAALADADLMLASLSTAAAGAVTASDVIAAVDDWFNNPAGGFASMGYLGDTGAPLERRIENDVGVTINARADHPALKELLRSTAVLALANDPTLALSDSTALTLVSNELPQMMSSSGTLTDLRADVGYQEERTTEAATRNSALAASLTIMRNELALVDPYATAVALKERETQLETQFTLTARLSNLSLVNYLR
jgi:flagellar hook-associated protein 3 FlgL